VVIDDSSPDGTAAVVEKLKEEYNIELLIRPSKLGLGSAITDGFQYILSTRNPPNHIVTMDADYSHSPKDIPRLMQRARDGCDLVIGSRYCCGGRIVGWNSLRYLISRVANFVAVKMFGMRVDDCTSGLRCYSLECVRNVIGDLHSQTYDIQIETVKQARSRGFTVEEIPITFTNRKVGKSKLTLAEIRGFLSYILKAKLGKW
jgi:dolichol-phosphate mannosyltransferase